MQSVLPIVTIDPIYEIIGARIKDRRKMLGKTQKELAHSLRISRGSLANIEIGRQNILVHQLYRFAKNLQLSPNDLLPPPPSKEFDSKRMSLSLPRDLKKNQMEEVARFFSQVATNVITDPKTNRAKISKE